MEALRKKQGASALGEWLNQTSQINQQPNNPNDKLNIDIRNMSRSMMMEHANNAAGGDSTVRHGSNHTQDRVSTQYGGDHFMMANGHAI